MEEKSRNLIENKFYRLYLVGFFLILALPLLNIPPWFSPPDWGKTIVFRIVLSILIFVFLWQIISEKKFPTKISSAFAPSSDGAPSRMTGWLLIALFGIYLLATIFSLDRTFSFWGSPYRSGGFINFAFFVFFTILTFGIINEKGWQKVWDFSILIGVLVSTIAVFQLFGFFQKTIIPFEQRPPSTLGGPIFLAVYLLLLSFISLSFGIKEKNWYKKSFYFVSLGLFIYVILVTQSRTAYFGLLIGFLYFLFFYPRKLVVFKIFALILLILVCYGIFYLNTQPELPQFLPKFLKENKTFQQILTRLSVKAVLEDPRISGWKISLKALKNRPILGYGPENFAIGFDKYYDPSLPYVTKEWGSWSDRAHNFIFDISISAGIPALIIYLLIFGVLFWQLQKLRNRHESAEIGINQRSIIVHGIQATFLAYLAANFFSFDTFSTYLISFLLISYSLHLISENIPEKMFSLNIKGKSIITLILFLGLVLFVWNFNIKPFRVNSKINETKNLAETGKCEEMVLIMEEELHKKTYLDSYLRLKYAELMGECEKSLSKKPDFHKKISELFKEGTEIRPYYTRNWILLGSINNILITKEQNPEIKEKLTQEANLYFEKAHQLSPKRQEVFIEWAKTYLITGDYWGAKEKAQKCIDSNQKLGDCWWLMALINIHLNDEREAQEDIIIASQITYPPDSVDPLLQLTRAYSETKNYQELIKIYQKLIAIKPQEPQYHASLAYTYKEIGQFEKARQEALIVLELNPNLRNEVETFLKTLPQ